MKNETKNQVNQPTEGVSLKPGNQTKAETAALTVDAKEIPVTAIVCYDTYPDKDTGKPTEYIKIELQPFVNDEDCPKMKLTTKWDSTKSIFAYYARKALKTTTEIHMTGIIKIHSYFSKKQRKDVCYPAIFLNNFYDKSTPEFAIKGESNAALFTHLVSKEFGEHLDIEVAAADPDNVF